MSKLGLFRHGPTSTKTHNPNAERVFIPPLPKPRKTSKKPLSLPHPCLDPAENRRVRGQSSTRAVGDHQRLQEQRALDIPGGETCRGVEEQERRAEVFSGEAGPAERDANEVRENPAGHEELDEKANAVRQGEEAVLQGEVQRGQERDIVARGEF